MYRREVNWLLVLFSLIGGGVGAVVGEYALDTFKGWPNILLMGLYFAILALSVGFMYLLAEYINPVLNPPGWKMRYAGSSWKMLVPSTLLMLFIAAIPLQLIYGLQFSSPKAAEDIYLALDVSGSMNETDPGRESFTAAINLIEQMNSDKRIAVEVFNDDTLTLQSLVSLSESANRAEVIRKLSEYGVPDGGTNIGLALERLMQQIKANGQNQRISMVILISDGYSDIDLQQTLAPYRDQKVKVNTVAISGISDSGGEALLRTIAVRTGGANYEIEDVSNMTSVLEEIYLQKTERHLVGERAGDTANSWVYAILRVLFITILGGLLGLSLGIVFDNRYLSKSFVLGGLTAGLLAGLIVEYGMQTAIFPEFTRIMACMVLAIVFSLSTLIFSFKDTSSIAGDTSFNRNRSRTTEIINTNSSGRSFRS